jgi:hypothetical protein
MKRLLVMILFIFTAAQVSGRQNLSLHYIFTLSESDDSGGFKRIYADGAQLFLTDSAYYITRKSERKVVDFPKEKIYYLNLDSLTYDETSLFTEIDYRHTEFYNSLALKNFYADNGIRNNIGSVFDLETFFGIQYFSDSLYKELNSITLTGESMFLVAGDTVSDVKTLPLKSNHAFTLKKFLLYDCHIHPWFIKQLNLDSSAIRYLSFVYHKNGKKFRAEYWLREYSETSSLHELNNGQFTYRYQVHSSLFTNLNKIYGFLHHSSVKSGTKANCLDEYNLAMKKKNYTDGFLILTECNLCRNDDYSEQFRELQKLASLDKKLGILLDGIKRSEDKNETETRINHLLKLKKNRKLSRGYIIDLFLAMHYESLNDPIKAEEYYKKIISGNPYITAVYYDLGNYLHKRNNFGFAWKCYEIALKLNKTHPLSRNINSRKLFYRFTYPVYF